jgi:DNA anti-recombination protein RmuC
MESSPARMATGQWRDIPRVAFTRPEMPVENQAEFYKQTIDSINAVVTNVKGLNDMLEQWRPWLRGMIDEQHRVSQQQEHVDQRVSDLEKLTTTMQAKYDREGKNLKDMVEQNQTGLAELKSGTVDQVQRIDDLFTRCDNRMKEMDVLFGDQMKRLGDTMELEMENED